MLWHQHKLQLGDTGLSEWSIMGTWGYRSNCGPFEDEKLFKKSVKRTLILNKCSPQCSALMTYWGPGTHIKRSQRKKREAIHSMSTYKLWLFSELERKPYNFIWNMLLLLLKITFTVRKKIRVSWKWNILCHYNKSQKCFLFCSRTEMYGAALILPMPVQIQRKCNINTM